MDARAQATTAILRIELADGPPVGALTGVEGRHSTFNGWIELASAIEDWRHSVKQLPTRQPAIHVAGEQPHTCAAKVT